MLNSRFRKLDINEVLNNANTINNERYFIDGTITFDEYIDTFRKLMIIIESHKKFKKKRMI